MDNHFFLSGLIIRDKENNLYVQGFCSHLVVFNFRRKTCRTLKNSFISTEFSTCARIQCLNSLPFGSI